MYVARHWRGGVFVVTEGEPFEQLQLWDYFHRYSILVLAFEPSELLDKYGPVPDYGLDPTGPFYWRPLHIRETVHVTEVSSQDSTEGCDPVPDCVSDSGDEVDGSESEEEGTDFLSGGEDGNEDSGASDDGEEDGYAADVSCIFEVCGSDAGSDGEDG